MSAPGWCNVEDLVVVSRAALVRLNDVGRGKVEALRSARDGDAVVISVVPLLVAQARVTLPDLHLSVVGRVRTRVEAKVSATESNQTVAPRDVPFLGTGTAVAVSRRDEGTVVKIALNR